MLSFATAIERVLGHEAGYQNGKGDPGGETKWGISKRSYPHLDIRNLTRNDAITIYKRDFWNLIPHAVLPDALAYQLLDSAVNSGIPQSIRFLQRALGVADDGHFGPISRQALGATNLNDVLVLFVAERLEFMTRLSNWPKASRGWARRIAANLRFIAQDN